MPLFSRTPIQCPRCGARFEAALEMLVDPALDPASKARLLTGQLNAVQCPNCQTVSAVATPLVYHDNSKELLITYVPVELNLPKDRQEKMIGDLLRESINQIPQEQRRGYIFNPRQALTMQGLIDQVLAADGITPEMMEQQREQLRFIETLLQTEPSQLPALIHQEDARIDSQFFQLLELMAQRMAADGRQDVAQALVAIEEIILQHSSFGAQVREQSAAQEQVVRQVAEDIRALGERPVRADFMNLAYSYDDEHLQALVGLVRPAFDQQFFQDLTMAIAQAPADQRDGLQAFQQRLEELVQVIDSQAQNALQNAAQLLQYIISSPNPDELIRANLELIDDTFMAVLQANVQEAERTGNQNASSRLQDIYNRVVGILRENMQPELHLINELLIESDGAKTDALLREGINAYGARLIDMMNAVGQALSGRSDDALLSRLAALRDRALTLLDD